MKWKDYRRSTNVETRVNTEEEDTLLGLSFTPNQTVAEGHYQFFEAETQENIRMQNKFDRYLKTHKRELLVGTLPTRNNNYEAWVQSEKKKNGAR